MTVLDQNFNSDEDWRERGYFLRSPPLMLLAYDPAGDGNDRDALVTVAREEHQRGEPHDPDFSVERKYRVHAALRLPQDLEFPDKLAMLLRVHKNMLDWRDVGRSHSHVFCVETNGVGYAMGSSLKAKIGNFVIPYSTVGNISENTVQDKRVSMPRLASLDLTRVLLETHRVKMTKGAQGAKDLSSELNSFVWRRAGRPEALTGQTDDLVMAMAGAIWVGEKIIPPVLKAVTYRVSGKRRH